MPTEIDSNIALVTLANSKEYLKIASASTSEDTILEKLINRISARFSSEIGRPLVSISRTEYYNGNGESDLILRCCPIVSIQSLYNADANRTFDISSEIIIADNVIIQKQTGIIMLWNTESVFLKGKANVKIIYIAGWVVDSTVPYDIQDALHKWIAQAYFKYVNRRHERISQSQGNLTTTFLDEEIPKEIIPIINSYKDRIGSPGFSFSD